MLVSDLIEALKCFPPNCVVLTESRNRLFGNFEPVVRLKEDVVVHCFNTNEYWENGRYSDKPEANTPALILLNEKEAD